MILYENPLRIEFNNGNLVVGGNEHAKNIRRLADMIDVVLNNQDIDEYSKAPVYYMYRKVYEKMDLRYDITYMQSAMINGEYVKTHGHYHPVAEDNLSYPEVYQVLKGSMKFVLQEKNHDETFNVRIVGVNEGEAMVIPPNNGHVSVNDSEDDLVMANLVFDNFEPDYQEYQKNRGAAYYLTNEGLKQNTNYMVKKVERINATDINRKYGFGCKDLLTEFYNDPSRFEFLRRPSLMFK